MKLTFIGTTGCIPDAGLETASFLINEIVMVDTGWNGILHLQAMGINPEKIKYLILTHLHQDHYLGLPQLLFYLAMNKPRGQRSGEEPFVIIGPVAFLKNIVDCARAFLQIDRFPELDVPLKLVPLVPGERYETGDFLLETMRAVHYSGKNRVEEAFICGFTERDTDKRIVFTGDTSEKPDLTKFAADVPLLIHDATHCSAADAATVACAARVRQLCIIHFPKAELDRKLKEARAVFPNTFAAEEGKTIAV